MLRAEVARQGVRIQQLELEVAEGGEGFEVVEHEQPGEPASASASEPAQVLRPAPEGAESESERREVAAEVGRFLRAQLDGTRAGSSGRGKVKLPNRCYVVCRDYAGTVYDPPLVLERFYEVRNLCKQGSTFRNSIFVGLPSKWEARVAVEAARLRWNR